MEQSFSLTSEVRSNCLVIATVGYINNIGGEAIAKEFRRYFETGTKRVIINLAQSKVVNSIGMSFLIEIIEQLSEVDGKLVFTNMDPAVEKMLAIMGLFKFAGKEPSVDAALKSFS
jgi:anti-anti-sigma factor